MIKREGIFYFVRSGAKRREKEELKSAASSVYPVASLLATTRCFAPRESLSDESEKLSAASRTFSVTLLRATISASLVVCRSATSKKLKSVTSSAIPVSLRLATTRRLNPRYDASLRTSLRLVASLLVLNIMEQSETLHIFSSSNPL